MWYSFSFTPSLGLHIAVFIDLLHFEPSGHRFPLNSTPNFYTHYIEGFTFSVADFNPVVWFTPKTVWYSLSFTPSLGLHIAVFVDPLNFEPSGHRFPPNSTPNFYSNFFFFFKIYLWIAYSKCHKMFSHYIEGYTQSMSILTPSSDSPQNRVVLIFFHLITWLTYCSFCRPSQL